jgi:hypothetical protein
LSDCSYKFSFSYSGEKQENISIFREMKHIVLL